MYEHEINRIQLLSIDSVGSVIKLKEIPLGLHLLSHQELEQ